MARKPTGKRVNGPDGEVRVHGKAANGEGSVYFAADGRWRATYWVTGERRPRTVSAKTRDKVIERRRAAMAAARVSPRASRFGPSTTVGELAHWWLENVQRHRVRASTWAKSQDRVRRIDDAFGRTPVVEIGVGEVTAWQASLLAEPLAPQTVVHHRQTLAQIFDEAAELGLIPSNPVRRVKPPRIEPTSARVLSVEETLQLAKAAQSERYGAVVALLFLQGWRVSEALGLAWGDLDLPSSTATVRRACVYVDHVGTTLSPPKTPGALGQHLLLPAVVDLLEQRRSKQAEEKALAGDDWEVHRYDGEPVELVFTTPTGGLVLRQTITKAITTAATEAGIDPKGLSTHSGRRSVVTALYAEAGESIDEIARFVGHASPTTTVGYVRDLGKRPAAFAERVASLYGDRSTPSG